MKMDEIIFKVRKQEDGWYLASPVHKKIGGATEAKDYKTLKEKVKESLHLVLSNGFHKEANLPKNPQIRLIYSELLFNNPKAEEIIIVGNSEGTEYRATSDKYINIDLKHRDLEELKKMISQEVKYHGHHNKHVKFRLEEVIQLTDYKEKVIS